MKPCLSRQNLHLSISVSKAYCVLSPFRERLDLDLDLDLER